MIQVIINSERCKGCMYCTSVCPRKLFTLSGKKNSRGFPYVAVAGEGCIGCKQCTILCPDVAITLLEEESK